MRSPVAVAVLAILFAPTLARPDPFSEFRIPDHSWRSGRLGVAASGDVSHSSDPIFERSSSSLSSRLAPQFSLGHDSDSLLWSLAFSADAEPDVRGGRRSTGGPGFERSAANHTQDLAESWTIAAQARSYPGSAPLGVSFSGSASGTHQEGWSREYDRAVTAGTPEQRDESALREDFRNYRYVLSATLAAGVGRVRDATVVFDAYVLEERLLEIGAITRPLSQRAREKLAALGYIAGDYANAHDRPARSYWQDVERILREDGVLRGGGLDAYSLVRVMEGYLYRIPRARGWFAGPIANARHQHTSYQEDDRTDQFSFLGGSLVSAGSSWSSYRFVQFEDELDLGGEAEFHFPLDWDWQLDASSQVTLPARGGERGLHANSHATLTWLIADRWQAVAALSHQRDYLLARNGSREDDSWRFDASLELGWYVEDHVELSASVSHTQDRQLYFPGRLYDRDTSFFLGLTYRFLGALDAPGLIEPVRPMR
ncbi:MAG TPA: hypothetical protein VMS88_00580 [Terriglobales bacterium]|nr:hypothetical protein [Terriglobales bacterium]